MDKIFFEAWKRGIGVHHANYHTKYRGYTEYLFRRGHLQVVFATETLSYFFSLNYFMIIN